GPCLDDRSRVGPGDPSDGDQRLKSQIPCPTHSLKAYNWVRLFLARCGKDWPNSQVVCRCQVSLAHLLGIVSRNSQPPARPDDRPHSLGRQIVLTHMNAIELGGEA